MDERHLHKHVAITLDIDWAPDWMIDLVSRKLVQSNVKATWLVTHRSAAIERLQERRDLFELGVHPNFMAGSTHGSTVEEVFEHCLSMVPQATCMRTHGLLQSTNILAVAASKTELTTDISLFLPRMPTSRPIEFWWEGNSLVRLPYIWEDDFESMMPTPRWTVDSVLKDSGALCIFDFHPIHVALNSRNLDGYRALRVLNPDVSSLSIEDVQEFALEGAGPRTAFEDVVTYLRDRDCGNKICELSQRFVIGQEDYATAGG